MDKSAHQLRECAQRLAASEESSHWYQVPIYMTNATCAQRLAASEESSLRNPETARKGQSVLNALRHQRNLHHPEANELGEYLGCSTPCGIRGIFTDEEAVRAQYAQGAQRLAASEESSLVPYAIDCCAHGVLNALRHQRNLHFVNITPGPINTCAQRLAASEESSPVHPYPEPGCLGCAQRLAASEESSPGENALRCGVNWRCSTPCGIRGIFTKDFWLCDSGFWWVLNALRHQRNLHPGWGQQREKALEVLNALRHQRNLHWHE